MTHFAWSPLVLDTVARNIHRLLPGHVATIPSPESHIPPHFRPGRYYAADTKISHSSSSWSSSFSSSLDKTNSSPLSVDLPSTIPGLVACHLRRGDYVRHCPRLARWGAPYMGFNQFAPLPDRFEPPEFTSFDAREKYFKRHCWPSVDQIVEKLRNVREEWEETHPTASNNNNRNGRAVPPASSPSLLDPVSSSAALPHQRKYTLNRIFILTNGWPSFVAELRSRLLAEGWEAVLSSWDLELDNQARYVSMAVDMALAQRAEVFIGNGFSSLTSNAVSLRMAQGLEPKSNRFWRRTGAENQTMIEN